jgi:Ca-activated chloride channel family protein
MHEETAMQNIKSEIRAWLWVCALLLLLTAMPEPAGAEETLPGQPQSGSLLWRMATGYVTATRLDTDVDIEVSGLVARVSVRQSFHNDGPDWVEGVYVFPLPDRAAVDRMRLHVGERFIEGEIREREEARKTYERARQAGRKASLVQQERANLFTTSVANVAPGELVVVEIEYLEDIRFEDGRFSLRFPMTLTPRYVSGQALPDRVGSGWSPDTDRVADASAITPPQVTASRDLELSLTARINAGMPLEVIASRYHPVSVSETGGRYTVTLDGGPVPMDHDFELVWRPVPSASPRAMAFTETIDGQPYHLLMLMPPDQGPATTARLPRETVFVIDTSGSMHGVSMSQARRALQLAMQRLQPGDYFNVIEFDSHTTAFSPFSLPADPSNVARALRFVEKLEAEGGTEMRPALSLALDSPPLETHLRQVVFITDGSVGYEDEMFSMIEARLGGARLFTVGIGSAPNSWFMRKAAEAGRGSYTYISALHEVTEKMDALFQKLEHPQVTDIEVQWPSGVIVDSYPGTVPDLYSGQPVAVRARASGAFRAGDAVRISGNSLAGAWSADVPLAGMASGAGVAALWARARIGELMDGLRRGGDGDAMRRAIVETALQHRLVSKFTSLVAVDRTPVRPASDPLASEQVANRMPYGQNPGAIFGFPATATDAPWQRSVGVSCLLVALLLLAMIRAPRRRVPDAART